MEHYRNKTHNEHYIMNSCMLD